MKLAIHQPHYMPWPGYLAKRAAADLFIYLDTVQYEKNGWQNRNQIVTPAGPRWLTIPVHARLGSPIHEVRIDVGQPWRRQHRRLIEQAYGRAPYFPRYRDALWEFFDRDWKELAPAAVASTDWLASALGVTTPARLASQLGADALDATERLVALCRAVGADTYLAGRDGAAYMDLTRFERAGISVLFQRYSAPIYRQLHGNFVPNVSTLDLLLTEGDGALDILRSGDAWSPVAREIL
jgi:hypothetical protein